MCKQDDGENGEICLPAQQKTKKTGNKLLIEEISGDKKKHKEKSDNLFPKDLQNCMIWIKRKDWSEIRRPFLNLITEDSPNRVSQ